MPEPRRIQLQTAASLAFELTAGLCGSDRQGFGLLGMRERLDAMVDAAEIDWALGHCTALHIQIPIPLETQDAH